MEGRHGPREDDTPSDLYRTFQCLNSWTFRNIRPNVRWRLCFSMCWWVAISLAMRTVAKAANANPVSSPVQRSTLVQSLNDNPDLMKYWESFEQYLTKYGYLTPSPLSGGGNLRQEDQLRDSIKIMQKFGNIPPTGRINAETVELLRRRRCGMPDIVVGAYSSERVRRFALQGQKWSYTNLTWSIRDWPRNIDSMMVKQELTKAFKVWSDASKLDFREIYSAKADIVVSFLRGDHNDGYPFDGRGIVLAHAFFPGEGIGGDAHFDAEEPWVHGEPEPGTEGVSLFAVAAHEFGHSLGLSHSSVSGSLMNPFYQSFKDNFQLPKDDTFGIQSLYGPRTPTRWEPLSPYLPPQYPPHQPSTTRPRHGPTSGRGYPPSRGTTLRPRYQPTEPTHPQKPFTCNTTFDAISIIRSELFIFKGSYFWRLNSQGLMKDYPAAISRFWNHPQLKKIDAVYERPIDTKIVFFSGKQYWLFNANTLERSYPRPLTDLGLPPDLRKIDAAMVWGYNGKTYLFSGSQYWRYDETEGRVELDYPRDMAMWQGVPYHIDAAFQYKDGDTYFFKDRRYWKFNDHLMRVHNKTPGNINQHWLNCPSRNEQLPTRIDDETEMALDDPNRSHRTSPTAVMLITLVIICFSTKFQRLELNMCVM